MVNITDINDQVGPSVSIGLRSRHVIAIFHFQFITVSILFLVASDCALLVHTILKHQHAIRLS